MKIAITIELDKESAELFQAPFKKLSDLMGMFEKADLVVEDSPDLKSKPPTKSAPQKNKKKSKPQKTVKATILKIIKKNKEGINTKDLQKQTGFTSKQISNNMFHLKKDKKVEKTKEGLFVTL
jgi:hypothetical protein